MRPSSPRARCTGSAVPTTLLFAERVPLGPVALITPWNFPVAIPTWKVAPALAFGNTVVLKPAELTPLTAWHLADVLHRAGLPPGVLNLVVGRGSQIGPTLAESSYIKAISFTGSNAVGAGLAAKCAERGIKFQLEMGGKNPVIVLNDADLDKAVELTIAGAMLSTGQKCTATSRVIVHRDVLGDFRDRLVARASALKVGDGMKADTYMGPLVSADAEKTVLDYIEIGKREGARLLTGGTKLEGGDYDAGFFVSPAVFDGVRSEMRIAQEEIFGPVVAVLEAQRFRRGPRPRQRHPLRPQRFRGHARPGARPALRPRDRGRHRPRQLADGGRGAAGPLRRIQGLEQRHAASRARPRASSSPRSRRSTSIRPSGLHSEDQHRLRAVLLARAQDGRGEARLVRRVGEVLGLQAQAGRCL